MGAITYRLCELAERVEGELRGNGDVTITGVGHLEDANPGEITFADGPSLQSLAEASNASALIVPPDVEVTDKPFIVTEDPRLAFSKVLELFAPEMRPEAGVHPTAVIGENVTLGEAVSVGANAYIGDGSIIGDGSVVHPLAYVGPEVVVGRDCEIHAQVYIGARVQLGDRVILHGGAAVGADGFGFLQTEEGHRKIPQISTVILDDDVEIGANSTVDRATVSATRIGAGTKIDDQVHVAHNVVIGRNCLLCGQVGIAGSTIIGDNVVMGGQAGVNDHVEVCSGAVIAAKAGVIGNIDEEGIYSGYPARSHHEQLRVAAHARKLPELVERIKELEQIVAELRSRLGERSD
ncbi:MAG: UDP-3-O-(3-hydroxymyristoyl)glucosamine N-acyltransferase [Armatimonadota bacterium]|nr:UDP-3-O-(3-hydroxymyristoyl)glucosamine N-acyltransferase [Armatimonadota bacterium]